MKNNLELIATKELNISSEMYKVIDFLNKNLKEYNLVFGISEKNNKNIINIYKEK